MALFIFGRFHAGDGNEAALADAVGAVLVPTRAEPGCIGVNAFLSTRDPRLFYIHSRWVDEDAFDRHSLLPHTVQFLERATALIDHPLDVTRAVLIG